MARLVIEADGGSRGNPGPAGYGAVVRDEETGAVVAERAAFLGRVTNNVAEYRGLIAGLEACVELRPGGDVHARMDSKLVVEQMSGRWQIKHPDMKPLAREVAQLRRSLGAVTYEWIPRAKNSYADRLANEAMDAGISGREWTPRADAVSSGASVAPTEVPEPEPRTGWAQPGGEPTTFLLLRHGQTPLSVQKRFSGIGDPELDSDGLAQAAAAASRLGARGGIDAVVCSPLRRARQTADAVAAECGVAVTEVAGLRETDFGDWDGYTFAEVREKWPMELDAWLASTEIAPPFGESFESTARRVRRARDSVLADFAGQTVVVVSHVTPIKTLIRLALEAPSSALYRLHLDLACLSEVAYYPDGNVVVKRVNDTGHLAGLGG